MTLHDGVGREAAGAAASGTTVEGFRLSPVQRRLWELVARDGEPAYAAQLALRIAGDLPAGRLEDALTAAVERYEILRTRFAALPGMTLPLQIVGPPAVDWLPGPRPADGAADDGESGLARWWDAMLERPLDLAEGPVVRAQSIPLADGGTLLLVRLSALAADQVALASLARELATELLGTERAEGEVLQYPDVSEALNELLDSEEAAPGREHWTERRGWEEVEPGLPLGEAPAGSGRFRPATIPFAPAALATPDAWDRLAVVGEPPAVLLACWHLLFWRFTANPPVVGVLDPGRAYEDTVEAIGLFAKYLPQRLEIEPEATFQELVARAAAAMEEGREWQEFWSWDTPSGGAPNGFAVGYEWWEVGEERWSRGGVEVGVERRRSWVERFLVTLSWCRGEGGVVRGSLGYDASRVGAAAVRRLGSWLGCVIEEALARPEGRVGRVPLLDAAGRREVLGRGAGEESVRPGGRLEDWVWERAVSVSESVAVVSEEGHWSYGALLGWAESLASRLGALGVSGEEVVGVCVAGSVARAVAVLGVLRSGGAYLPLDPGYPEERLSWMVGDAGARWVVVDGGTRERVSLWGCGVVEVGDRAGAPAAAGAVRAWAEESGESLAYVIYTSGSTGRPKGVMVPHRGIGNRLWWMVESLGWGPGLRVVQKTPLSFDASAWELFVPWLVGGTAVLAVSGGQGEPGYLAELMGRERVEVFQGVPSLLRVMVEEPALAGCTALRWVFSGGEALGWDVARGWSSRLGVEVWNLYGPTEGSIDSTSLRLVTVAAQPEGVVALGHALSNVRVMVADGGLVLCPRGVEGEIWVGGRSLARGYRAGPGLTAERFVPDPFGVSAGGRLYRTGDRGRWDAGGRLEFLGRVDEQVKVRGVRVEPGEVESVLASHPGVREAAVVARGSEGVRLVAYVAGWSANGEPPAGEVVELGEGLRIWGVGPEEAEEIYREVFERESYLRGGVSLCEGDCVFDVGANVGLFTLFVASRLRRSRVYAFEPVPAVFARLRSNVARYGLEGVELFECALSSEAGEGEVTYYPGWSGMSGLFADAAEERELMRRVLENRGVWEGEGMASVVAQRFVGERYGCRVRTLSEVLAERRVERIDLLKVDVEKSELAVLAGIAEEDWPKIHQVVLEVHDREGALARVRETLEGRGFRVAVEQEEEYRGTGLYTLYGVHPARAVREAGSEPARGSELVERSVSPAGLRGYLGRRLPEAMVPSSFVVLESLPKTPSGKVDRRALPEPETLRDSVRAYVAPRTAEESALAGIWAELLRAERVGVHDNFFELGGDSILSIQVVSRARQAGLQLAPRAIFDHQTVADLAASLTESPPRVEGALAEGREEWTTPGPLLPSQRRFFGLDLPSAGHYNQALLLSVAGGVEGGRLGRAVVRVVAHHPVLAARFERGGEGWVARAGSGSVEGAWGTVDLSGLAPERRQEALSAAAGRAQASLDLAAGPLLRVVGFDLGSEAGGRLLWVIHHLVVDGVSWRILLEDLAAAYESGGRGELPAPTTPAGRWAEALAAAPWVAAERGYWLGLGWEGARVLPGAGDRGRVGEAETVAVELSAEETRELLGPAGEAYRTRAEEALVAALGWALGGWAGGPVVVEVEGHGREEGVLGGMDLSRTVGWFTTVYPVVVPVAGEDWGRRLRGVKEALRGVPSRGLGWGVLRYLREDAEIAALPAADVSFNYLGQLDQALAAGGRFSAAREPVGRTQAAEQPRSYRLDVTAAVTGGRLRTSWRFAPASDPRERVERLAAQYLEALRALLAHCRDPRHQGSSPADFPLAAVDQATVDRLEARLGPLEDLYPLSPLQQGLLFHTLEDRGAGVYVQQLSCTLRGALDEAAFAGAWARVVERHPILRTAFVWHDLDQPLQAVVRRAGLPLEHHDWSDLSVAAAADRAKPWLAEDAREPFPPDAAPLMRLGLAAMPDGTHLFRWTHHHLLLDGWSMVRLLEEVLGLYGALAAGGEPEAEPARPFRDYIAWLAERDQGAAETHWRAALAGLAEPTLLARPPASAAGSPPPTYRELSASLSPGATRVLDETARRERITMNTLAEGAWALLLARTLGRRDVVFGTVSAGRPADLAGAEEILGVFINNLPLRVAAPPEAPVHVWLRDLQAHGAEQRIHEYSPLTEIHRWSPLPASVPLFDTLFDFTNYPVGEALHERRHAVEVEGVSFVERTNYPISLNVVPGASVRMRLTYRADALDDAAAARLLRRYRTILHGLGMAGGKRLGDVAWLTAAERHQVLVEWNDTERASPERTLHDLVAEQIARTPDAIAAVFEGSCLSYAELGRRAALLATRLSATGLGIEGRAGVALERSLDLLVALLAILETGAAYVPVDPGYPVERRRFMVEDAGLSVLLAPAGSADDLAIEGVARLVPTGAGAADPDRSPVPAEAAAYVIYTSGSTGRPKGVAVPHRGIVNRVRWMGAALPLAVGDRVLHKTPLSFDVSVAELFWPLASGACLVVARPEGHREPRYLAETIERERVTALHFVPSMLRVFLDGAGTAELRSLRRVVASGEALPWDLAAGLRRLSDASLHNLYGPTEASVDVTSWRVDPDDEAVPIGRPVDNTAIHILDDRGAPCPIGVAGELAIGGVALARGYVGKPALTAERFVPDPFGGSGARFYLTGDRAVRRGDGAVEFLGRLDGQVKLRGFRVELGEIETLLAEDASVAAAVVAVGRGEGGSLIAYVVPRESAPIDRAALRTRLASRLPEYMVPHVFVELEALPLTPSGKVDRQALPAVDDAVAAPARGPGNPLEAKVARVWEELLDVRAPGVDQTFFELGGNSLLAMRLVSRLREATGVELSLRTIVERPTIAGMAAAVAERDGGAGDGGVLSGPSRLRPDPASRYQPFPLNDVQQAYWVGRGDLFELGNVSSHTYLELDLTGLDVERFARALRRVIDRHDMLRAVIASDGSQRILAQVPAYEVRVLDLAGVASEERERRLDEVRQEMSHQVLPADRWPLFEVRASRLGDGRLRLHVSVDVLITDAWSSQILYRDLARYYADPEAELPHLELSFRDYVLAEIELRESELYRRSLSYWKRRVETLPPGPELPLARRPGTLEHPRFTRRRGTLDSERWQAIKARAAAAGLTPSGVLLAAFAEVLALWSKSPRFTLNLTLFNRLPLHPHVEELVGDFTSVTLLEVDAGGGHDFVDRARTVQDRLWEDLDHRYAGGIRVLRELARIRGRSSGALMPVVFTSTLGQTSRSVRPRRPPAAEEVRSEVVYSVSQTPQVWLDHQVVERVDGGLGYHWDAVEELFPPDLVDDLLTTYRGLLDDLAAGEEGWRGPRIAAPETHLAVQRRVNSTAEALPTGLLHAPVEIRMKERPEATAVVTPRRRLDYRDLDRLSSALAHRLRSAGARPNRLVALVMEKGWEQVVGALAVLRAGAAYLPVEASLPAERRRHLLERGEVEIVLTQPHLALAESWPPGLTVIEVSDAAAEGAPGEPPPVTQGPDDLAYVIFTSGSTGQPKGVAIEHRGARNTVEDVNRRFAVGPADRVLGLSYLGFDLSVWDLFGVLSAGGAVVLPDPGWARDPGALLALAVREKVTVWNSVPALMAMMVEHCSGRASAGLPSLRLVLLSGDWIPVDLPARIRSLSPEAVPISLGGATEASIWSILHPIGELDPAWSSIPYGRPMANQRFEVLDERLEPRPFWVPGELYIGGVGLARGYWNDPEKTAASFIEHPRTGERLYRTGDLGRWHPDGTIEFLGREDLQVKVQGHRIELGEIEATLETHPSVRSAVVVATGEDRHHRRLVAFVVPGEAGDGGEERPAADPPRQGVRWPRAADAEGGGRAAPLAAVATELDLLELKLSQPGRRPAPDGAESVPLPRPPLDDRWTGLYLHRRSDRVFRRQAIALERLGRFLASLAQLEGEEMPLPKYAYPSAGSLYPVQCYLHLRAGAVEGLGEGLYYYDPRSHALVLLSAGPLGTSVHSAVNAPVYESAGFTLFLVARPAAITPVYGEAARDFCLLEAGYVGQLLMTAGPPLGIGLCPVGSLGFPAIRHRFALEEDQWLVHALIGGAVVPRRAAAAAGADPSPSGVEPADLVAALGDHLGARLPAYMVPAEIVLLDSLPLTANGKVDRGALAARSPAAAIAAAVGVEPRNPVEAAITAIWGELLGHDQVGIHDNFFQLGGDSVLAIRAVNRARSQGLALETRDLFELQTVAELAARLALAGEKEGGAPPPGGGEPEEEAPFGLAGLAPEALAALQRKHAKGPDER